MLLLRNLTVYNAVTPDPFTADILIDGGEKPTGDLTVSDTLQMLNQMGVSTDD